ncbi:MAG: EAL domain-containing protein [Burkholderiales bacterium]|nr:EAL domain-containing protein [Burkholderiales bacterium]
MAAVAARPTETRTQSARIRHRDGGWRIVEGTLANQLDVRGVEAIVANFRDVTDARRADRLFRALVEGTALSVGQDYLHALARDIAEALDTGYVLVGTFSGRDTVRTRAAWWGGQIRPAFDYTLAGAPCARVAEGESCYFPRDVQSRFPADAVLREIGASSYFGCPLRDATGRPIGLLAVIGVEPINLTDSERGVLEVFASRAAAEIERLDRERALHQTSAALRAANRALRVLGETSQALARSTDEHKLLDAVCRTVCGTGGYRLAWVGYVEPATERRITVAAHAGEASEYIASLDLCAAGDDDRASGPGGRAIRTGETQTVRDLTAGPVLGRWTGGAVALGFRSMIVLPLRSEGRPFGVLAIYAGEPDAFYGEEARLLEQLAEELAFGIVSLRGAAERAVAAADRLRLHAEQQAILEHAGVGIAFLKDNAIVRCNGKFARMFGYSERELAGISTERMQIAPAGTGPRLSDTYGMIQGGETFAIEARARRKDGARLWVRMTINAVDQADLSKGVIWVVDDITDRKSAEERVRRSEERFRHLTALASDWYWEQDAEFRFTLVSDSAQAAGRRSPSGEIGKTRWEVPNAASEDTWQAHRAVLEAHRPFRGFEYVQIADDGEAQWLSVSGDPMFDEAGRFVGYRGTGTNITARKRAEEALRLSRRAIEASTNGILVADATAGDYPIIFANPAFEAMTGYSADEVRGRNPRFLHRDDTDQVGLAEIRAALRDGRAVTTELRNYRKDGTLYRSELSISPVRDDAGRISHWLGVATDVTERKRYEAELERQANYDPLTGLANRSLLFDRIRQAAAHTERSGRAMAVLLLDLDRFKLINDGFGHVFGDELLRTVSGRLRGCVRRDDTVARLGGDEFVVMLTDMAREDDASNVAGKILEAVAQPVSIEGRELVVTASIGIAIFPRDGREPEALLKNADAAMYRSKEHGRNAFEFYTEEMNARAAQHLRMRHDLARALDAGEFRLFYQPIVGCRSGAITGAEALLRWQKADGAMVSPAEFIPLAEDSGLIVPIGKWALHAACAQARAWLEAGLPPVSVSVNLSPRQFRRRDLVAAIDEALAATGLAAASLGVELTEGTVMQNPDEAVAILHELAARGIGISIDDFGTGYSSLGYLKRFPVNDLKIDRSFVRDIATDRDDAAIVNATIGLAHTLDVTVIAEGVETAEQREFLIRHGCDYAQGFLFSRPAPADEFAALLAQQRPFAPNGADDWSQERAGASSSAGERAAPAASPRTSRRRAATRHVRR